MNKEEMLKAVDELENEYDAYYMMNKYGDKNTHAKQFEMLSTLKGELVPNALGWIRHCYDCYYKHEYYSECDRTEKLEELLSRIEE